MSLEGLQIQLIAAVVAVACALPGVFLVLRRMAMMSDAISHAILVGIVLAFFITENLSSPLLIIAAAATAVLTVSLVELLNRTRLVYEDAAIGITFPALFSIGVILIARYADDVHLDTDAVLLGELAFAPFYRFKLFGQDLGPRALWLTVTILIINIAFFKFFYKELKLATFDAGLAATLGFSPGLLHYGLMTLVSITAVGAFDAVGSILVVALMIAPPATAYLLTNQLSRMIWLSGTIGVASAISGYWFAHYLDASIAGSIAMMTGVLFGLAFLLAPYRGIIAIARRRASQRWEFAQTVLAIHLFSHEGLREAEREAHVNHLSSHLHWEPDFARQVVRNAERRGFIHNQDGRLDLTEQGREMAQLALVE
jgi:manganese/zinc/iron transport system permease protein